MSVQLVPVSDRGRAGIAAVRAALLPHKGEDAGPLDARRMRMAQYAALPAPASVELDEVGLGGVPCICFSPPDPRGDVLYLHGGAYVLGSPHTHKRLAAAIALAAEARVWAVDYRLAPEHPYPAALEDAVKAWKGLAARATRSLSLCGDSAGGGLALAVALALRDRDLPSPAALALIAPWADLGLSGARFDALATVEIMLTREGLVQDRDRYRGRLPADDPRISPLFAELRGLPPTLVQVGTEEVLLDDAERLAARLQEAEVPVTLELWEGMTHSWPAYGDVVPEAALAIERLGTWLRNRWETKSE